MKEVSKKILPQYFNDVRSGIKSFEVRKDEDDIQVGDVLLLEEWKPDGVLTGGYTGRCIKKRVKYVLRDIQQYGLQEGYCIIGLEEYNNGWIPCSERLPEDCTIYEVTARFGNGMCYTEFAYYDESKGEWWKHDDDGLVNVLAWKEHSMPYIPKE